MLKPGQEPRPCSLLVPRGGGDDTLEAAGQVLDINTTVSLLLCPFLQRGQHGVGGTRSLLGV